MKPIIQLDQNLINKIAAGEVVERPLSVVKELTENSIDAGASVITVEIKGGGLTSIRVTDNGGGIPAEELSLAFARHATSKISALDDLFAVGTLGFRGEALYSIAAVSQVELLTKTPSATSGVRAEVHGGRFVSNKPVGCPDGTTIIVSNLFYNTPARRKFLKKDSTEAGYVGDLIQRLALSNPRLSFRYISDGKPVLQTSGIGGLPAAALAVYGRQLASAMVPVDVRRGEFSLTGLVGKPEAARGNRQHSNFFINGRYIQSPLLRRAVEDAVKTMLPSGKFPAYALNLALPFSALDVNVHPAKMDVRFEDEDGVFNFVRGAVYEVLTNHSLVPEVRFAPRKTAPVFEKMESEYEEQKITGVPGRVPTTGSDKGSDRKEANNRKREYTQNWWEEVPSESGKPSNFKNVSPLITVNAARSNIPAPETAPSSSSVMSLNETAPYAETVPSPREFFRDYKIMGLLFGTYWLVAQGDSLFVIDRHAAHERVLYDEILAAARAGTAHSQPLLTSVRLKLTPGERRVLEDNRELFERFGFETETDGDAVLILAVPFLFKGPMSPVFFTELLDKMDGAGFSGQTAYEYKENAIATMACKAAVKANDKLNDAEAEALIEKMLALENPFTCPHGRPTVINISKKELERKFKR